MPRRLWIGGKVQAPLYLTDPEPRRPDFVAWIDTGSGKIVESEITEPAESTATLVSCLSKAIRDRKVKRPDRIRVADVSLAEAVRAVAGDSIAIEIAPTPELAQLVESMAEFLDSSDRDPKDGEVLSYFENGRVLPATVARMFETAARLYRVGPWDRLWDADTIGLDIPAYGLTRAVLSVIGRAGQNFGFVIFESAGAFDAFGAAGSDPLRRKNDLGASMLSLNFESKSRIPDSMRREISRHSWKVAGPKAYPFVMAVDRDRVHRPLRERDVLIVCAAAEGLTQFISKHGRQLSPDMPDAIVEEYSIGDEEKLTLRLTAPHPEMPWLPDDAPFADDDEENWSEEGLDLDEEDLDGDDEDATSRKIQETADAFVEDQRALGKPSSWLDAAGVMSWSLLRYKADYVGGSQNELTEWDAEEFLLDHFPRKVSAEEDLIDRAPEALIAFYDWLAAGDTIPSKVAAAVRDRVPAIRNRFLAAARDSSRYGPAKSFLMQMRADGVDLEDEAAVRDYMLRYNARLGHGGAPKRPSAVAMEDEPRNEARPRLSPRWVPPPGVAPPGRKTPCPCGSGRAYGKCCMPR